METFGERLRKFREQKGLSLDELAAETGISKAYLWKLERKPDTNPSIELVQRLAAGLETTVSALVPSESGPKTDIEIPPGLQRARERYSMSDEDVQDLAAISFRGRHPMTAEEWGLIYLQLQQIVEDDE